jgi:V8-like Glu-specific endopeptidase
MDLRRATLGLAAPLLGCGAEPSVIARTSQPIIGGDVSAAHLAVVRVEVPSAGMSCTGALVGPRVVLTAKHCVQRPGARGPEAPWAIRVRARAEGDGGRADENSFAVVRVRTTPGVYSQRESALADLAGSDVAALTLATSPDITPLGLGAAPRPGDVMVAAGFGIDERGIDGVLRVATTRIRAVAGDHASTDAVTCAGDSGGPLLDRTGAVAGVLSGAVGSCGAGESRYTLARAAAALVGEARCESGEACPASPDASLRGDDLGGPVVSGGCRVSGRTAPRGASTVCACAGVVFALALRSRRRREPPRTVSRHGRSSTTTGGAR